MLVRKNVGHSTVTPTPASLSSARKRLRQRDHGRLGDVVRRHARRRQQSGGGGDVQDVPAALRAQARREDVAAVDHAPQVDAHDPAPVVERHLADAAADGDAGVVDDEIDAAERCARRSAASASTSSTRATSQRTAVPPTSAAVRCARPLRRCRRRRCARGAAGELETEGAAEAAAGAGDDGARRIGQ